ncbi:MAG: T9SS type A sorting domain-containing protein [Bacteroidetes bacterium]|nr:T9SS type A sorting domain-containing protein [Bacteroidota bacterium]
MAELEKILVTVTLLFILSLPSLSQNNIEPLNLEILSSKQSQLQFNLNGYLQNSFDLDNNFTKTSFFLEACIPAQNLAGEFVNPFDVLLTWEHPLFIHEWIHWDDGFNYDAIGLNNCSTFSVAVRFSQEFLTGYEGAALTKVALYPNSANTNYILKIWKGNSAATLLYEKPLPFLLINQWNTVEINKLIVIDTTEELWFGYTCANQPVHECPAGCDAGPAIAGFGDLISLNDTMWENLSSYGLDYNWNLQGYVTTEYGENVFLGYDSQDNIAKDFQTSDLSKKADIRTNENNLLGFNVYHDDVLLNEAPIMECEYLDENVPWNANFWCVRAVYDTCISEPVCIWIIVNTLALNYNDSDVIISPNPVSDILYIKSISPIKILQVLTLDGSILTTHKPFSSSVYSLNVTGFKSGVYYIKLIREDRTYFRKFIKL